MTFAEFKDKLKVAWPLIPADRLQGPVPGMTLYCDEGLLVSARNEGGLVLSGVPFGTTDSVIITKEWVNKLLHLENPEWSGLQVKDGRCRIKVGRIKLEFGVETPSTIFIPEYVNNDLSEVPVEFLKDLTYMSPFMCEDDRKVNMYGMYASERALLTCDNIRAVKLECVVPPKLQNTFIPNFAVNTIIKNRDFIKKIGTLPGHVVCEAEKAVHYFSLLNATFPRVDSIFEKLEQAESISVHSVALRGELEQFMGIAFDENRTTNLEVKISGDKLDVSMLAQGDEIGVEGIPLEGPIEGSVRFVVKFHHFLNGLMNYPYFRITKDAIVMKDAEGKVTYVVMKMVGL